MVRSKLDKQIREYISDLKTRGATINMAIVLASLEVIMT